MSQTVTLIKAENDKIKRQPENSGGLNIDNLDIDVYSVLDNKENEKKVKVNDISQTIKMNDTTLGIILIGG